VRYRRGENMRLEMPLRYAPWRTLLLVVVIACAACTRPADQRKEISSNSTGPSHNGIYAVLIEAATREEAQGGDTRRVVLPYEKKYTDSGPGEPLKYVAIDPSSFVPLILEGAPESKKDGGGKTILSVTLKKEYVKALEDFTRAHLGGKIAILLDGEIVTLHKVRSVISEGKFQVTRCTDNACEVLRAKLTE
jgi:preprotein translocase subunit SecD